MLFAHPLDPPDLPHLRKLHYRSLRESVGARPSLHLVHLIPRPDMPSYRYRKSFHESEPMWIATVSGPYSGTFEIARSPNKRLDKIMYDLPGMRVDGKYPNKSLRVLESFNPSVFRWDVWIGYYEPGFIEIETYEHCESLFSLTADILNDLVTMENTDIGLDEFNFQRNNDFNILVALKELDETIAAFLDPKTFLSYGGFQWGVLPLVSDIKSIGNSVAEVGGKIGNALDGERIKRKSQFIKNGEAFEVKAEGDIVLDAPLDEMAASLAILADELGLHPDLSTIWDGLPLSFLLDAFVPIGDLIERLHPRGWFKPKTRFSGCISATGILTSTIDYYGAFVPRGYYMRGPVVCVKRCSALAYVRKPMTTDSEVRKLRKPDFQDKAPSGQDLFNLVYIFGLGKKLGI